MAMNGSEDKDLLTDGCWALSHIIETDSATKVQAFIDAGAIPLLIKLLKYNRRVPT
jgi:hypothetical protein